MKIYLKIVISLALFFLFAQLAFAQVDLPIPLHYPADNDTQSTLAILYMNNSGSLGEDGSNYGNDWTNVGGTVSSATCNIFNETCGSFINTDAKLQNADDLDNKFPDYSISVAGWVNASSLVSTRHYILTKPYEDPDRFYLFIYLNGTVGLSIGNTDALFNCNKTLSTNNWNHIAVVVNNTGGSGGIANCYINSTLSGSSSYTGLDQFQATWALGDHQSEPDYFRGRLADWVILNKTLTQTEISNMYLGDYSSGGGSGPQNPPILSNINCTSCGGDITAPYTTDDTTPTFTFDTDINADCRIGVLDQNYTGLGVTRNCTSGDGTTSHTCSVTVQDELVLPSDYVYIGCQGTSNGKENATSSSGALEISLANLTMTNEEAIQKGINFSVINASATVFDDQKVYLRDASDNKLFAQVDKVVIYENKRWVFNVGIHPEVPLGLFNISQGLYVYDVVNKSATDIAREVGELINQTAN